MDTWFVGLEGVMEVSIVAQCYMGYGIGRSMAFFADSMMMD